MRVASVGLLSSLLLAGCTTSPEAAPVPAPAISQEPVYLFYSNGSATQNLPVFESLLRQTGAGTTGHELEDSIAALVDAGFTLDSISHTPVNSKIAEPADSVSLAVAFAGECLIAQFSKSWLTTAIAEPTVSGCLIGDVENASLDSN